MLYFHLELIVYYDVCAREDYTTYSRVYIECDNHLQARCQDFPSDGAPIFMPGHTLRISLTLPLKPESGGPVSEVLKFYIACLRLLLVTTATIIKIKGKTCYC